MVFVVYRLFCYSQCFYPRNEATFTVDEKFVCFLGNYQWSSLLDERNREGNWTRDRGEVPPEVRRAQAGA